MTAKKRKPRSFRATSAVKAAARAAIGTPPSTWIKPNRKPKERVEKHKKTLNKMLEDSAD